MTFDTSHERDHARLEPPEKPLSDVLQRRLPRRTLLQRAAVLGLSVPAVASLVAACGDDDEDELATDGSDATEPASSEDEAPTTASGETDAEATAPPDDGGAAADETPEPAAAGEGTRGGTLIFGLLRDPIGFDPHINYGASSSSLQGNVYNALMEYDQEGNLIGSLAEAYEISDDGLEYVFTLRQGVTFHNGNSFTAEDVVFNLDQIGRAHV